MQRAAQDITNPFQPGMGLSPPLLAGRQEEQAALGRAMAGLMAGKPCNPFLVYGPRGTGKTALLLWVAEECARLAVQDGGGGEKSLWGKLRQLMSRAEGGGNSGVTIVSAEAPIMLQSKESLLNALRPVSMVLQRIRTGVVAGLPGAKMHGETDMQVLDLRWENLTADLLAVCQQSPLVLLIDEAHEVVDWSIYRELLGVVSSLIKQKAPVLLVLAGTPGLPDALRTQVDGGAHGVSGIERGTHIGLNSLAAADAAEAISVPLHAHGGYGIDEAALHAAAEAANCYPFFLQCWGEALWDIAHERGGGTLSLRDVDAAGTKAKQRITPLYINRYNELREGGGHLQRAAVAVATAFKKATGLRSGEVEQAIEHALRPHIPDDKDLWDETQQAINRMKKLGYIWSPPDKEGLTVPGTPSLLDYTLRQAPP